MVIKEAFGKALVHYYPFAGRLREASDRKLAVDCTGEGILFIEADVDARLEGFGASSKLFYPYLGEFLFNSEDNDGIINTPLLLIQVTRLLCGGFTFGIRVNHTMADGVGIVQFLTAVAELSRGAPEPSLKPVWKRELLCARTPRQVTCFHLEYKEVSPSLNDKPFVDLVEISLFFGPKEIKNIRDHHLPANLRFRPTFEIVTACLWKCRTSVLRPDYPDDEVRIVFLVNARSKFNPPIPNGYYGNVVAFRAASATAGKVCQNPLGYAMEKVRKAKSEVTEEYRKSLIDFLVLKKKPLFAVTRTYMVTDLTRAGIETVDFGWGPSVYGGPRTGTIENYRGLASSYMPSKNDDGEKGMVVSIFLPAATVDTFTKEIQKYTKEPPTFLNKLTSLGKSKI